MMMMFLSAANTHIARAQEYVAPAVTISKDKVKIDGKAFYSHIVLERQTLFSISKAYNVTIDEIYHYNPTVKENGLRKNDIIIIPVVTVATVQEPVKYEPVKSEPTTQNETRYTVSWYDDLSSVAAKFNVSEDAIIAANGLKSRKLKNRQVLVIPSAIAEQEANKPEENVTQIVQTEIEASVEDGSWEYYSESPSIIESWLESYDKPKVNISLVLPFKANGKSAARNNMDFYSGALLAAREITDSNIALQLNVVDIANDSIAIDIAALKESDVVIGPISTKDIAKIQKVVYGNCPIVSPLDQRVESLTQQYSGLIQAPTSQSAQFNDLANWIMEDMTAEDKLIIIYEKGGRQNDNGRAIMGVINARGIPHTPFSYSILEGRNIQSVLESNMTATGVNRVIIASESEAFVNDAVRNLNLIVHNKFNVVLYAPSKIRTFETIEIENLHNTSLHTSLSYNIDYDEEKTRTFLARYRAMFGTEPTQFAFQGYDLTKYFAEIIAKYQENWVSYLKDTDGEMLQSSIMFKQTESGSYVNQGTRRIIYGPGYSIRAVKTSHSQQPVE